MRLVFILFDLTRLVASCFGKMNSAPDSNFSLQQSCSANLQQNSHCKSASLKQVYRKRVSHHASNFSQACRIKLINKDWFDLVLIGRRSFSARQTTEK
ncbi:hypothetical protein AVEN_29576-1 [Araneus ventricosus]|uniref:Secreted protein n=1 Tax=Araneus ventricosus TaxID=182803 RepID=A0A4Y2T3F6_ARAVE|nr:hypothetical protein AVEN_29576-1 [Araneus ventricosus]